MGLTALSAEAWLDPAPDLAARVAGFAAFPEGVQRLPEGEAPGCELARMLGIDGGLAEAALAHHEDMCLLTRRADEPFYRLVGTAVAFPTDWIPARKMGLSLTAMHAPIHGYAEQLASGVDHFMARLRSGRIFGRCNWFIAPTGQMRWLADEQPQSAFAAVTAQNAGEMLFVRCERQTLRRLPETGAILFTIGVYVAPLRSLSDASVARLAQAVAALVRGEGDRRGAPCYSEALRGFATARGIAIASA